jgi:sulfatase maturation enzyme AslB (radical SAM superfamily)
MNPSTGKPGLSVIQLLAAWQSILTGSTPMMSIEITRECPLSCPGCYAYDENHLGGTTTLRSLADYRGDELVDRIVQLVRQHRPLHVSLVGGEPLVRHRELSRLLPILSRLKVHTMVVTSAVVPIPQQWMSIPRIRVAVSVDGLPEHHDVRRKPATYERILRNIAGCQVNIHWTITHHMMTRPGYLEQYLAFWNARPEVVRIWASVYTPQKNEHTAEMLSPSERRTVAEELERLQPRYRKLLMNRGIARAIQEPPTAPSECLFARMSTNYSADLRTRVEPCIFGGTPDCSQCGCAISSGLHWLKTVRVARLVQISTLVNSSVAIGSAVGKLRSDYRIHPRWAKKPAASDRDLVQIETRRSSDG